MGFFIGLSGFLIINGAMLHYLGLIGKEKVPVSLVPHSVIMLLGALSAVVGVALAGTGGTIAVAVLSVALTGGLLYLFSLAPLPDGELIARIGEPLPPLVAPDHDGHSFDVASLKGKRVMVKFFRGSW